MHGLGRLLDERRIIVCLGCGGVGKTTIAASLALRAALDGRRVLCLTIDPARRLATSLGLGRMRVQDQRVDDEAFERAGLATRGELWAAVVDGKATFDRVVRRLAADAETAERILQNRIYRYVSASMPGVQEYMSMERLCEAVESDRFDLVVLDTPPTSNALDFLDAPRRVTAAFQSPAFRWLLTIRRGGVLSKGASFVMRYLARLTGTELLEQMADLALDFEPMLDGLRERAATVATTLRSNDVASVLVTSPDPLAVDEAIFLNHRLVEMGLRGGALVVNRVRPLRPDAARLPSGPLRVTLERAGVSAERSAGLALALRRAAREEQAMALADRREVERLERSTTKVSSAHLVPVLERDVYDLRQLAALHTWLFERRLP